MADGIRFEAWTLPESATFERKAVLPVVGYQLQVRNSQLGGGWVSIPDDYDNLDEILYVDPDNHANDEASLIRAFRDDQLLAEFYALRMSDTFSDEDPTVEISGDGIEHALDRMRVLPYDYTGTGPTRDPDWIYGAPSILDNTDFDSGGVKNELQSIWNDATGGTFTLSDGTDTTSAIAYNASAATIKTRLETDITSITSVDVTGSGAASNPWVVEFANPADPGYTLTADDTGLTGDTIGTTISLQTPGGSGLFGKWYQSTNPSNGLQHGVYDTFAISTDQARSGSYSLKIDGAAPYDFQQWPGAQQLIKVQPGKTYRASVWLYSASATDTFRLVVRDLEENLIATTVDTTLTASTWTELSIPTFTVPEAVTTLIFRVAYVGQANPSVYYVDDALLAPGFAEATLGEIFNDLLDDLTTHLSVGSWLTRSWTDALDSDGVAWDQDLQWAIKRGQSLLQLLEYADRWGYEYRIRWTGSAHALDLFNPGAMGTDHSTSNTPAIAGRVTGSGPLVRRAPDYTWILAEGDQGQYGVSEDTTLSGAWAKWMGYWANKTARTSAGLVTAAAQRISDSADQMQGLMVRQQDPPAGNLPLEDILIGDKVQVLVPGKLGKRAYRTAALTISSGVDSPVYEWHLSSRVFTPEAAVAEGVNRLLRTFRGLEDMAPDEVIEPTGWGPGIKGFTIRVAASNAYAGSKNGADVVCDGVDDEVKINLAIQSIFNTSGEARGRVLLSEGDFYTGGPILLHVGTHLLGMGREATIIHRQNSANSNGIQITDASASNRYVEISDLSLDGNRINNTTGDGIYCEPFTGDNRYASPVIRNVWTYEWDGDGIQAPGSLGQGLIVNCRSTDNDGDGFFAPNGECLYIGCISGHVNEANGGWGFHSEGPNETKIYNCTAMNNTTGGIGIGDGDRSIIVGNWVKDNGSYGIRLAGGGFDGGEFVVTGNLVQNNTSDGLSMSYAFAQGGERSIVSANLFSNNGGWGAEVSAARYVHFAGNYFYNNTSGCLNLGGSGQGNTAAANGNCNPTGGAGVGQDMPGVDTDAIHDNVAAEISAITAKTTPTTADYLLIEDAAASDAKKSITIADLPAQAGADSTAIHDDTAAEISAVTEKTAPVGADLLLIEDSAASNAKKRVQIQNLPTDHAEIYAAANSTETTIGTANTWVQVLTFTANGQSQGSTPDHTNDHITIGATGTYLVVLSAAVASGTGSGGKYEGEIQINNGATRLTNLHWDRQLGGGGGDVGSVSASGLASLTLNDTVEFWVRCSTATNLLVEDVNLSLMRIA